jgi:hypothetical protein
VKTKDETMNRVKHSADFQIDQPAEILYPLFSPEGEKLWVPGWDYENIMGSENMHEDFIFLTKKHDHAASKAIWLVKKYIPSEYLVEFYRVEPGEKVGVIAVECSPLSEARSKVNVTYEYIAISEKGKDFISSFTSQVYEEFIGEWQQLLEAYFELES